MNALIRHVAALTLAATALSPFSAWADEPPIADWSFNDAAGTPLNLSANSGSGLLGAPGAWDVAIAGVATTGSGQLLVRNTGGGGSGTRTTYADFGPVPASVSSGTVNLYASFASWNLAGANAASLTLALVEGNDFSTAQFTLAAGPSGLSLSASSDASGNGGTVAGTAGFASTGSSAFTVRLSVDLGALSYSLAYDAGAGFVAVGGAAVDSFTAGVNSLRLSLAGDFTAGGQAGSGLSVDRIWVAQASPVPEPAAGALLLAGLVLLAARRRASAHSAA